MIATSAIRHERKQTPEVDRLDLEAQVDGILNRYPAVGFALGVVHNGRLEVFEARGLADVGTGTPITEDTIFRVASISKTFTAVAAMQLYERGLIDLDAPANSYLRAFQLVPARASFRPATLRHLLTHTAGLPETVRLTGTLKYLFGESFALDERVPTLGDYYRGRLRLQAEPGTRFAYTDHSFAVVGQIVEDVSHQPLDRYFREHIFEPLGMADTDLRRSEKVRSRLATGYTIGSRGPKPVADRQWLTAAASMVYSSPRDMARYVAALLGGGANEHGSILKPTTLATMFAPQYQPHPLIPGMGLAFSRVSAGGHRVVEHEGILPGFNSQIFAAPDDGVGVIAFTNGSRQAMFWLPVEVGRILSRLIGVPDEGIRSDVPQHPEKWAELCGWYPFTGPLTDMRMRSILGLGAEVFVRRGQLMVRLMSPIPNAYRGFPLHADDAQDPYAFRIDHTGLGIGTARVAFSPDAAGAARIHFGLLPISLTRRPGASGPRPWIAGAAGALALGAAAIAVGRRRARRI